MDVMDPATTATGGGLVGAFLLAVAQWLRARVSKSSGEDDVKALEGRLGKLEMDVATLKGTSERNEADVQDMKKTLAGIQDGVSQLNGSLERMTGFLMGQRAAEDLLRRGPGQ